VDGECGVECPAGLDVCGDGCVDVTADPNHCGECGNACTTSVIGASPTCVGGVCGYTCGTLTECDGACVDVTSDPNHCGSCDQICPGGRACVGSQCAPETLGCTANSQCGSACPSSVVEFCDCGMTVGSNPIPVCYHAVRGCSATQYFCHSDADCAPGSACINRNGPCGGCDGLTQGKGICSELCTG
jgi:hypothetical protein